MHFNAAQILQNFYSTWSSKNREQFENTQHNNT